MDTDKTLSEADVIDEAAPLEEAKPALVDTYVYDVPKNTTQITYCAKVGKTKFSMKEAMNHDARKDGLVFNIKAIDELQTLLSEKKLTEDEIFIEMPT